MYHHFRIPIVVVAVLTGAGLAAAQPEAGEVGGEEATMSATYPSSGVRTSRPPGTYAPAEESHR